MVIAVVIMVIVVVIFAPVVVAISTVFIDFAAGQKRRRHHPQEHEKNRPSSSHDWVSFFKNPVDSALPRWQFHSGGLAVFQRKWDASMRGDDNVQGQKSLPPNHFIDSPIGYRYSPKTHRDPVFFGRFFPGAARSCVAGPAGQPPRLISAVVTKLPISCN